MPNRYPAEQRARATRMALDRLDEYGSAWAVAQALGPMLGVGPETLRKWVVQAPTDARARPGPSSEKLAEIKRLKKENADLREAKRDLEDGLDFLWKGNVRHGPRRRSCVMAGRGVR